jgi:hypothetical protein
MGLVQLLLVCNQCVSKDASEKGVNGKSASLARGIGPEMGKLDN